MHAPQLIWLILTGITLGVDLTRDGEAKTGKHRFSITFVSCAVSLAILWWGGFFSGAH